MAGNEVARVGNVEVVGVVDSAAKPFDKTVNIGRGFTNIEAGPKVISTHVGHMVRFAFSRTVASYYRSSTSYQIH
jgi:hypothetical protein